MSRKRRNDDKAEIERLTAELAGAQEKLEAVQELKEAENPAGVANGELEEAVAVGLNALPHFSRYSQYSTVVLRYNDKVRSYLEKKFLQSVVSHRGPKNGDPHRAAKAPGAESSASTRRGCRKNILPRYRTLPVCVNSASTGWSVWTRSRSSLSVVSTLTNTSFTMARFSSLIPRLQMQGLGPPLRG